LGLMMMIMITKTLSSEIFFQKADYDADLKGKKREKIGATLG